MLKNDKFIERLRADIALIEAKLIRFEVRGMGFTAGAKDRHEEHIEELEKRIDEINEMLSRFEKPDDHQSEGLRDGIQKSLQDLQDALESATLRFATEPGVADPHGGDDGPFPYGKELSGRSANKK